MKSPLRLIALLAVLSCMLVHAAPVGTAVRFEVDQVNRAGITGGPQELVRIATESATGSEMPWTAQLIGGGPWVQLLRTFGATPAPVSLRFNPDLAGRTGVFEASLLLRSGTESHLLPITYAVDGLNVTSMVADPLRPVVYGLSNGENSGSVVVVNPYSATIASVIGVGRTPSGLTFSPDGSEIYVVSAIDQEISRIDPTTLQVTGTIKVPGVDGPADPRFPSARVAAGRTGRLYHVNGSEEPLLRVIDFNSGELISTLGRADLPEGELQKNVLGDLFLDPGKDRLHFTLRQFNTSSQPLTGVLDVSADRPSLIGVFPVAGISSTLFSGTSRFLADLNGERLFFNNMVVERADLSGRDFPDRVVDLSAYGDLAVGSGSVYDVESGHRLADLAATESFSVFTPNQAGLLTYSDFLNRFEYWPLPSDIRPPSVALRPAPASGGSIEVGDDTLSWSGLPLVDGYRVYFGTDSNMVALAQPGSPADMGVVAGPSYVFDSAPASGIFYWRVDALRGDTVIKGSVFSFTVAPFRVTPDEFEFSTPLNARVQQAVIEANDAEGNPVAWTATGTASWIRLPKSSGIAGESLVVEVDPAGRAAGTYSGSVRVTSTGVTTEVPVKLVVFEADLTRLAADPQRPVVYGLHPGANNQSQAYVVKIDAATGDMLGAISLSEYASDFVVHPFEDRLYLLSPYGGLLQVIDLESGSLLESIKLPDAKRFWSLAHGRAGRVFIEVEANSFKWETHQLDTTDGSDLGILPRGNVGNGAALIASDPEGRSLYANGSGKIQRFDISQDEPKLLESGRSGSAATIANGAPLLVSGDASHVVSGNTVLDAGLRHLATTVRDIQTVTGDGRLAASGRALYWSDSGFEAGTLPFPEGSFGYDRVVLSFSNDDRFLIAWDKSGKQVTSLAVDSLVDLPGTNPVNGQRLRESPTSLSWSPVGGATGYRVFLGTDEAAVGSADFASNLLMGTPTANSLVINDPLDLGYRFYWRIDAVTPGGVIKGAVSFFDLPFVSNDKPIVRPGGATVLGEEFGYHLAAGPDGLAVGEPQAAISIFDFNPETGSHGLAQTLPRYQSGYSSNTWGEAFVLPPGALIAGDVGYNKPAQNSGGVFIHERFWDGKLKFNRVLSDPTGETLDYLGGTLAYAANQLLVGAGQGFSSASPGRVFSWFEHPDWLPGAELVASPREQADYFGDALALDGTRALIGAPGPGRQYNRPGCGFLFEFDAAGRAWSQVAHLQPSPGGGEDLIGGAVALQGDIAVLGGRSRDPNGSSDGTVYVFTRRSATSWVQTALIKDPRNVTSSNFGSSLALHGDFLFIANPSASWRGQNGGVVYVYHRIGDDWEQLAPIVPPPGGQRFGQGMTMHEGWLFISQFQRTSSDTPDRVLLYRIDGSPNQPPSFVTPPPAQVVSGMPMEIPVTAIDPDGNEGLVFGAADLPLGLVLEDLGNGRARIIGTPTDSKGTEYWIRIAVTDADGVETVQTALGATLGQGHLPLIGELPDELELESGEDLRLAPDFGGIGPFTWQWQRDGIDIPDAVEPVLFLANVGTDLAGIYTVTLGNVVGRVTSAPVAVGVSPADRFAGDWETFGGSTEHDGHQPANLGRHTFQPVWEKATAVGRSLNPLAVAGGVVFATPNPADANYESQVHAYDQQSGELLWSHPLGRTRWATSPSWHAGRVYVQSKRSGYAGQLWCLDAATGAVVWEGASSQFEYFEAPAVDDDGVFTPGSSGAIGMYGYDLKGARRFSIARPKLPDWTPTISEGRLFSWVGGEFSEHDRSSGEILWKLEPGWNIDGSMRNAVSVIRGGRAYLAGSGGLSCVDVERPQVRWSVPTVFEGSPAFAAGRLYVLEGTTVRSLDVADGGETALYQTGADESGLLIGQPLLLNDYLVTSSESRTYVFHIESGKLVQELPHGGFSAYSGGHLLLAGPDGTLRAYFANAAPEFSATMPSVVDVPAAAGDLELALAPYAGDADPADELIWAIVSVSNPDIFRLIEVDAVSGDLSVIYNPWQSGSSDVILSLTDPAGNVTEGTITFTVPEHPEPSLAVETKLFLNRQTGLYEQSMTVTNRSAREIAGFDLSVTGLPVEVVIQNASNLFSGGGSIQHRQPLAAGASVTLIVEYYTPVRGTPLDPEVAVALVALPEHDPAAGPAGVAIDRCILLDDGGLLIEFISVPGATYEVQYSNDATNWKVSPARIRAAGNRVQWIDRGPPRTDSAPITKSSRYYRVRELGSE